MAVGLFILSGARQGERVVLEASEFRVGGVRGCRVYFDPQREPQVEGRAALFQRGQDGWYVKNVGRGELVVNDEALHGVMRLADGDIVELSESGPGISFHLIDRSAPRRIRPWTVTLMALAGMVVGLGCVWLVRGWWQSSQVPNSAPGEAALGPAAPGAPSLAGAARDERQTLAGKASPVGGRDAYPQRIEENRRSPADVPLASGQAGPRQPPDAWQAMFERVRDAVWLVSIEDPDAATTWPFATASAIRGDTLLTSGTVGVELVRFKRRGCNVWAVNQALGAKHEVQEVRVPAAFAAATGKPERQIYSDLSLLTLSGRAPRLVELAGEAELSELDGGRPVALVGIVHDTEPMHRFQSLPPELTRGKLLVVTGLDGAAYGPKLLHVRATLTARIYGSPVLNVAGRLVGVYAEAATAEKDARELPLHYVTMIDRALIQRGLAGSDGAWVAPAVDEPDKDDASNHDDEPAPSPRKF